MGVPGLFAWCRKHFPQVVLSGRKCDAALPDGGVDQLYLDLNHIIHAITHPEYPFRQPANEEEMLEGELMKRQAEEDLEREKIREVQRQKKMQGIKEDIAKSNRDQIRQQQLMKQRELEEEVRIEKFTQQKAMLD